MYICKMAKKNTLLYLDENLVQQAKAQGLNLSEVAENAIRYELILERVRFKPDKALEEAKKLYIPIRIKSFSVKKLGPIEEFSSRVDKTAILVGPNGSGKTLLLKKLYGCYIDPEPDLATLKVETEGDMSPGSGCVIFDDFLDRFPEKYHNKIIDFARKKYKQAIFTSSRPDYWDALAGMEKHRFQVIEIPTTLRDKRLLEKDKQYCEFEMKQLKIKQKKIDNKIMELDNKK